VPLWNSMLKVVSNHSLYKQRFRNSMWNVQTSSKDLGQNLLRNLHTWRNLFFFKKYVYFDFFFISLSNNRISKFLNNSVILILCYILCLLNQAKFLHFNLNLKCLKTHRFQILKENFCPFNENFKLLLN
jgi:hypothetical protein